MAVESPAAFNQAKTYNAEQTRRAIFAAYARTAANNPGILAGGLLSATDLQLSAPVSGLTVNVSSGECIIGGSEGGAQGGYYARATSQTSLVISAANVTNPRIDTVCGTISDAAYTEPTGGSGDQWALQVITGTPTPGATLTNLSGVGALPASSLLLGYVLVPANATNIITADIGNVASVVQPHPPGLLGATAATRYAGATASGAPTSGTFKLGDFVIDQTGTVWVCTTAGSPGTWTSSSALGLGTGRAVTVKTFTDGPLIGAGGTVTAFGPAGGSNLFPTACVAVFGHTGWYTTQGGSTPSTSAGWIRYYPSGRSVLFDAGNATAGNVFPVTLVAAIGY